MVGQHPSSGEARPPHAESDPGADERTDGEILQGIVERVTWRDEATGFAVVRLSPERGFGDPAGLYSGPAERATAVGLAPDVVEGLRLRLAGRWSTHRTHGRRFLFESLAVLPPLDEEGLVRYLSSRIFRGVGPTLARRIVGALGPSALARIRAEPACLAGISGLRKAVREDLVSTLRREIDAQESLAFLLGLGITASQASALLERYGNEVETVLRADPYVVARGISGIGFATADRIARRLGIPEDAAIRRRAALLHVLTLSAQDGHSCLSRERLVLEAAQRLGRTGALAGFGAELDDLAREQEIVLETRPGSSPPPEALVYLPALRACEAALATNLVALMASEPATPLAGERALGDVERRIGLELHPSQRAAVLGCLARRVAILTGGPGVGKTTIVRLVVELAEAAGARVALASPTGRAAKRLAEATGREARTLHRLLGWQGADGGFAHDERAPLEADLIVVDELSMVDLALAHHMVKAIQPPTRLLMLGDPDQLPSVSAGNVLADLLVSRCIPTWRLTQVFRQEQASLIVHNAHRILAGRMPDLPVAGARSDFYFFPAEGDVEAAERVLDVVTRRIPARFGMDWPRDVQVLSPMYRGACGVDGLNERLRAALATSGAELVQRGRSFREGDRVIHVRNDYEREVFNGDMGRVSSIAPDGSGLSVSFPDRDLFYARAELGDLQLAFAITVHRAQGGEFPAVVVPLVMQHSLLLQRNLLYTAVTRARSLVVLVGSIRALRRAVENAQPSARESALADRMRALVRGRGAGELGPAGQGLQGRSEESAP
jgi:exodeoxyribonuclease V alpha subunit